MQNGNPHSRRARKMTDSNFKASYQPLWSKRPNAELRFGSDKYFQLWRVVHDKVVARSSPSVTAPPLDHFCRDSLVIVDKKVPNSNWLQLALPGNALGGKQGTVLKSGECAYLLTDGTQVGLSTLV